MGREADYVSGKGDCVVNDNVMDWGFRIGLRVLAVRGYVTEYRRDIRRSDVIPWGGSHVPPEASVTDRKSVV